MVEAERDDEARNLRGNEVVDRPAGDDTRADLGRGGRHGRDLEELDALGALDAGEDVLEPLARVAGPGGDAQADAAQDLVRLAPGEKVGELVRADDEHGVL